MVKSIFCNSSSRNTLRIIILHSLEKSKTVFIAGKSILFLLMTLSLSYAQSFSEFPYVKPISDKLMPNRISVVYDCNRRKNGGALISHQGKRAILDRRKIPPGHVKDQSCKAQPTRNFDRRRGDPTLRFTGVIYNPVPGPPLGERPRIRFKYFLQRIRKQTEEQPKTYSMIIQLFNLSRGGHRGVVLNNLTENQWVDVVVDMSKALRPRPGGGDVDQGPFREHDRVDDIQFYIDPRPPLFKGSSESKPATAHLWIDDIMLYDAAHQNEYRPAPAHTVFTAWFDTGSRSQKAWPGDFQVVEHGIPQFRPPADGWDHIRTIPHPPVTQPQWLSGAPWIRVGLRGAFSLGRARAVMFRYYSTTRRIRARLTNIETGISYEVETTNLNVSPKIRDSDFVPAWSQATLDFSSATRTNGKRRSPTDNTKITHIEFFALPDPSAENQDAQAAELRLDDIWLLDLGK